MAKRLLILCLLLIAPAAAGRGLLRIPFTGVRPLGMGNAFLAISNDNNALWYNPAGLARVKSYNVNLIDTSLGVDSLDTFNRAANAVLTGDTNNLVRSDREFIRANFRPTFIMPFFSIALYNHMNTFIELDNLTDLTAPIDIYAFNDTGVAAGFAIPMSPYASIGATVRGFLRAGADTQFTGMDLLNALGVGAIANINNAVYTQVMRYAGSGLGLAVDAGTMVSIPLPKGYPRWTLAATMNDIGATTFRPVSGSLPPRVGTTVHFGTALEYDLGGKRGGSFNIAADYRDAFNSENMIKHMNIGMEYKAKFFAIRAGWSQGYVAGGFSLEFPPHTRIHFATNSVELGSGIWQLEQRHYTIQFVIGFNPN